MRNGYLLFGVMMYEIVVGRVPFSADTPFSIIHDHIYTPLPLPSDVNPSVTADLESVLLKALAKERADRYPDISSFISAFSQAWIAQTGYASTILTSSPDASTIPPGAAAQASLKNAGGEGGPDQAVGESGPLPPKKRRIPKWAWIVLVVFLCFCCVFTLLVMRQNQKQIPAPQQTANAFVSTLLPTNLVPTFQAAIETSMPIPAPVQDARKAVEERPDDPQAHLKLAMAYAEADMPRFAMEEMKKTADMGAKDQEFLTRTAEEMMRRQYWLPAVLMYLRLGELVGMEGLNPQQQDDFHESVYKAAVSTDYQFPVVIPMDDLTNLDKSLALIAQARYFSSRGESEKARKFYDQLIKLNPELPETRLTNAEIAFSQQKFDEARKILDGLLNDITIPQWIKKEAETLMGQLPK
jgi:tetratricopeptide (TPR) repeat protein